MGDKDREIDRDENKETRCNNERERKTIRESRSEER